ncbi:TPA: DUF6602 domain-containing protein [Vibrio harveyi]|uniref:DUF6602 domain-containing protein n=1 Tax=Vibrio harveyi TaxID=669 RepID=UPI0039093A16
MLNKYLESMRKISGLLDLELDYSPARYNFEKGVPLENALKHFFKPYFPLKFGFTSGYLVDQEENISNQCDWIIFDAINTPPIISSHGIDTGVSWFPYDGAYGNVEVKRTLNKKVLERAIEQIGNTRSLKREPTDILHIHPVKNFPKSFFGLADDKELKVTNKFYTGIYAYLADEEYTEPQTVVDLLVNGHFGLDFDDLPEYIAVHGRYFIKKVALKEVEAKKSWNYTAFPLETNGYAWLKTAELTSGFFYFDLITQFANMDLSSQYQMTLLNQMTTKLSSELENSASLSNGKEYFVKKAP